MNKTFRKIFFQIHLWLSIPFGIVITVMCLTGALLVFETEILRMAHPARYYAEKGAAEKIPLEKLVPMVDAQLPDSVTVSSVSIPANDNLNYSMGLQGQGRTALLVDPYTGEVKGKVAPYAPGKFFTVVRRLHRWFMFSYNRGGGFSWGKAITGYSTLAFVFILISGIVVWIPRTRKALKARLQIKTNAGGRRFWYDTHVAGGMYALLFLLAFSLTGLTWSFGWYRDGFYKVFGVETTQGGGHGGAPSGSQPQGNSEGRESGGGRGSGGRNGSGAASDGTGERTAEGERRGGREGRGGDPNRQAGEGQGRGERAERTDRTDRAENIGNGENRRTDEAGTGRCASGRNGSGTASEGTGERAGRTDRTDRAENIANGENRRTDEAGTGRGAGGRNGSGAASDGTGERAAEGERRGGREGRGGDPNRQAGERAGESQGRGERPDDILHEETRQEPAVDPYSVWDRVTAQIMAENPKFKTVSVQDGSVTVSSARSGNTRASDRYAFDPVTGEITGAILYKETPKSGKIRGWIYSVHVGTWGGMTTRILSFIACLIGASLPVTGYYFYFRKKFKKRRNRKT